MWHGPHCSGQNANGYHRELRPTLPIAFFPPPPSMTHSHTRGLQSFLWHPFPYAHSDLCSLQQMTSQKPSLNVGLVTRKPRQARFERNLCALKRQVASFKIPPCPSASASAPPPPPKHMLWVPVLSLPLQGAGAYCSQQLQASSGLQ